MVGLRQSYLKPTFKLLDRPILSTYNDWVYKFKFNNKPNQYLTFIGVGSYDKSEINEDASSSVINQYILNQLGTRSFWHTFNALNYQSIRKKGYSKFILSHQYSSTESEKEQKDEWYDLYFYKGYSTSESKLNLNVENVENWEKVKFTVGAQINWVSFYSESYYEIEKDSIDDFDYLDADLSFLQVGLYTKLEQSPDTNSPFYWSVGLRVDSDTYTESAIINQFSPRIYAAYKLKPFVTTYFNFGQFYQLPPNIGLAYRDEDYELINKPLINYFKTTHWTLGIKLGNKKIPDLFKIELYRKAYSSYPISAENELILSALENPFSNFTATILFPDGNAQSHGLEVSMYPKFTNGFYGLLTYTFGKSTYEDEAGEVLPTNYDIRHILNIVAGKHTKNGWHFGMTFRMQTGLPYTPWDLAASANIINWERSFGSGLLDYTNSNTERISSSGFLDLRIDKKIQLKNCELKAYLDLLSLSAFGKSTGRPLLLADYDIDGLPVINLNQPNEYVVRQIENKLASLVPSLGVNIQF